MKRTGRILIALTGALAIHGLVAAALRNSFRRIEVYIPTSSIEIVAEGPTISKVASTPGKTAVTKAEPVAADIPASSSGASGAVASAPSASAVSNYLSGFRDRLSAKIKPPRGIYKKLQVVLKVTLLETGEVKAFAIDQSSGLPELDQSVLQALEQAKPFPRFTSELAGVHELSLKIPIVVRGH